MKGLNYTLLTVFLLLASDVLAASVFISPDGSAVITTNGLTSIPSTSINSALITSTFSGWSVLDGGPGPGTITTPIYTAGGDSTRGGAQIQANYSVQNSSSGWIQIVTTNDPLQGQSSPRVDVLPVGETTTPFVPPSFVSPFHDFSQRFYTDLGPNLPNLGSITWSADLYPASETAAKTATVYNGISWGWKMKPALEGNSTGTFLNPSPSCPPATCSGTGSNAFSWGDAAPDQSALSFQQTSFNPKPGDKFSLGTLTFHNGTISGGVVSGLDFDVGINLVNLPSKSTTLHTSLALVNTPNSNDPLASADYINFVSGGFTNSLNILEGRTATADLIATIDKTIKITPTSSIDSSANLSDETPLLTESDVDYTLRRAHVLVGGGLA